MAATPITPVRLAAKTRQRAENLRVYVGQYKLRPAKETATISDVLRVALEIGLDVLERHRAADEAAA